MSYKKLVEIGFEKLAVWWPANNSKWNLSEAVQAYWEKSELQERKIQRI